jgi:hypothetical protein
MRVQLIDYFVKMHASCGIPRHQRKIRYPETLHYTFFASYAFRITPDPAPFNTGVRAPAREDGMPPAGARHTFA